MKIPIPTLRAACGQDGGHSALPILELRDGPHPVRWENWRLLKRRLKRLKPKPAP